MQLVGTDLSLFVRTPRLDAHSRFARSPGGPAGPTLTDDGSRFTWQRWVSISTDACSRSRPPSDALAVALALALTRATRSLARPDLAVVLVEPKIPQNSGNVSRSCAATKVALHLVAPAFELDDKKLKRAGLDYWDWVCLKPHASVEDFLEFYAGIEGEKRLIAFSKFGSTHHASEGLYRSRTADGSPVRNFLLFGT